MSLVNVKKGDKVLIFRDGKLAILNAEVTEATETTVVVSNLTFDRATEQRIVKPGFTIVLVADASEEVLKRSQRLEFLTKTNLQDAALPLLVEISDKLGFVEPVPDDAQSAPGVSSLEEAVEAGLPVNP